MAYLIIAFILTAGCSVVIRIQEKKYNSVLRENENLKDSLHKCNVELYNVSYLLKEGEKNDKENII